MKITLNQEELIEVIHNALCNGLGWISGYGLELNISQEDYQKAKANIQTENTICYEDVLIQHLKDGNALEFYDNEQEEDVSFTLESAKLSLEGNENVASHILDMINEQDDAITADCILQTCLYDDVIFG